MDRFFGSKKEQPKPVVQLPPPKAQVSPPVDLGATSKKVFDTSHSIFI